MFSFFVPERQNRKILFMIVIEIRLYNMVGLHTLTVCKGSAGERSIIIGLRDFTVHLDLVLWKFGV